jgi:hypothetical protein
MVEQQGTTRLFRLRTLPYVAPHATRSNAQRAGLQCSNSSKQQHSHDMPQAGVLNLFKLRTLPQRATLHDVTRAQYI